MAPKKKNKKNSKNKKPPLPRTIALTGGGFKGQTILKWLEKDPHFTRVIYFNNKKPKMILKKAKFYRIDLTETLVDAKLAEILKKEKVDTLVHTAIPVTPPRNLARAHELVSVGSMYICNAAAEAKVRKLILSSTVDLYGAYPDNPNYLTERHPVRSGLYSKFLKDKIDAEKYFLKFQKNDPHRVVTVLRFTTILGPTIRSFKTKYLSRWFVPTVWGFDPMVQFIHEQDMLQAYQLAILKDHPGVFNFASDGVIPLSKAIRLLGKINVPMPLIGLKTLVQLLWYMDISPAPANRLDFLKYLCCVAIEKAKREMGYRPKYNCKEALMEFVGAERLRGVHLEQGVIA